MGALTMLDAAGGMVAITAAGDLRVSRIAGGAVTLNSAGAIATITTTITTGTTGPGRAVVRK